MVPEKTDTETRNLQNQIPAANQKRLFSVKIGWFENGKKELSKRELLIYYSHMTSSRMNDSWIEMTHFY